MQNIILIISTLGIHVLAWFTIGPQLVLIIRNSLVYSRKTGVWTAVGFAIGNFIHITYSVVAIKFVTTISPDSFLIIKFLGVTYLIYLGIKTILVKTTTNQDNNLPQEKQNDLTNFQALRIGLITNLLSPKAPLFFISIFGTIITAGSPWWVIIFLMCAMPLNTFMMASMWSYVFSHRKIKSVYNHYQKLINMLMGTALIILALIIIFYK